VVRVTLAERRPDLRFAAPCYSGGLNGQQCAGRMPPSCLTTFTVASVHRRVSRTEVARMLDRRLFLAACSRMGLGATLFPGASGARASERDRYEGDDRAAAVIADVPIPAEYRDAGCSAALNDFVDGYDAIHELHLPNGSRPPSISIPRSRLRRSRSRSARCGWSAPPVSGTRGVPHNIEDLCFATVRDLGRADA